MGASQSNPPTASLEEVHGSVPVRYKSTWRRLIAFVGPAYLVSVGYMDPGNWATDIEGGARFGYALIWVLVMSNLMAILLQTLAARLGIVTGRDLAQGCRLEYSRPLSVSLWILCELAIVACDLAEVLGTIIGLHLLFSLPYLWGCLVTVGDTFLLLLLQRLGIRRMEAFIVMLVATIGGCFLIELIFARPHLGAVAAGLVPSLPAGALYVAIGIIGATVMPHNLYLHSALVQTRAISRLADEKTRSCSYNLIDSVVALNGALFVNAAILIMAAATFFTRHIEVTNIEMAHELLDHIFGGGVAPIAFGVALVCAGQSSTVTGTLAGQIVMEGFVKVRLRPWVRRLVTRSMALVPAVLAIVVLGDSSIMSLLILSQVVLSLQLPFAIVPLVHFTSDRLKMGHFVSPTWLKVAAWACAAVVIALNTKLVIDTLSEWMASPGSAGSWAGALLIPVVVAIAVVLAWITFVPLVRGPRAWVQAGLSRATHVLGEMRADPIKQIGVAIERTDADADVLGRAVALARNEHASLSLVHVSDTAPTQVLREAAGDVHSLEDEQYLDDLAQEIRTTGLQVDVYLRYGYPAREIVRFTQETGIDLLVLGSHGHRLLGDLIMGSTVEPVRHGISIPVLVVRSQERS